MSTDDGTATEGDVHEDLMEATYRALCEHGYADLTMQDIADEADKSTSLLHYHYDTKEGLLVAFLEFLLERSEERLAELESSPPAERLECLIERFLPDEDDPDEWERFHRALLELRTQAPYREAYREQLRRNKAAAHERFVEILEEGIETGAFRDVDPEDTATFILSALDGARASRVTLGDRDHAAVRDGLAEFVLDDLCVDADDAGDDDDADGASDEEEAE